MGAQMAEETKQKTISSTSGGACVEVEVLSLALALWAGHEFIKRLGGREGADWNQIATVLNLSRILLLI